MVLFKIGTRELGKGFVVGWKTGRHRTMEGRKSSLLTSPGSRRFLCFRAVSCPISTNGSISRRVAQHDSRSSRQTGAPPLFPIPVPSSSNRGEAAAPCLLSFSPQRPYPPGQFDAFWLPSPKATTPPAVAAGIAPRHARARRAPAPCARRYNDLLPRPLCLRQLPSRRERKKSFSRQRRRPLTSRALCL